MKSLNDKFVLSNGYEIPCVGFGTYKTPEGQVAVDTVKYALEAGYRHIDTAFIYGNEQSIGQAIRESGIPREEIFVTSKVWNEERGYKKTLAAFETTMENLGLDYLDLYLIHWPASESRFDDWEEINVATWKALIEIYKSGRVKAIGVSNFCPHHLGALMKTEVKPMVNQIEFHPGHVWEDTLKFCQENDILVEAWSPIARGRIFNIHVLKKLAEKYGKTVAQLCLRWELQKGVCPLPKSVTPSRILENADIFDFVISDEDMEIIDRVEDDAVHKHPDTIDF